jgi:hypothetical protein
MAPEEYGTRRVQPKFPNASGGNWFHEHFKEYSQPIRGLRFGRRRAGVPEEIAVSLRLWCGEAPGQGQVKVAFPKFMSGGQHHGHERVGSTTSRAPFV